MDKTKSDALTKFLLALRFIFIFTTGYIHPDEFFQSPSPSASFILDHNKDVLNDPLLTAWEFLHESPQRDMLIPLLTTGPSFAILKMFNLTQSWCLLYAPRVCLFIMSLVIDRMADRVLNNHIGSILYRSLWPVMVFHTRPFSNTMEAFSMVLCLYIMTTVHHTKYYKYILLGFVSSFGLFTRFTFPMFAWPVVWCSVFNEPVPLVKDSFVKRVAYRVIRLIYWSVGFLFTSAIFVSFDTAYFSIVMNSNAKLVVAPFNNLLYNLDVTNLAKHTLHNRFLHSGVNMPMLYGPLYLMLLYITIRHLRRSIRRVYSFFTSDFVLTKVASREAMAFVCVVSGLGLISLAKHQEPRFLIPLSLPMCLMAVCLHEEKVIDLNRIVTYVVGFSTWAAIFFGVLHQMGVLNSLFFFQHLSGDVVYHHTYMPPSYLLLDNKNIQVHDLGGGDISERILSLLSSLSNSTDTYIVSGTHYIGVDSNKCSSLSYLPHFSTETWSFFITICKLARLQ
ncbi:GPI mannosyltransferase [Acrasis kona]|uniref:Mannosyltransferase n=1 Tax=Acrasis kona TaxID=1008807 RepID=A0AAW2ZPA2_9EUKA